MTSFNSALKVSPIVPRGLDGVAAPPARLVSKRAGLRVAFASTAPFWLINAFRNIWYDYVTVKHLRYVPDSYVRDAHSDATHVLDYLKQQLSMVVCRDSAPVGAKFSLAYKNDREQMVIMQMGQFRPAEAGASMDTFDPVICFCYLHPGCRIEIAAEVVEAPGYKSGMKPIVANFAFSTARERELAVEDVDAIFEGRSTLEMTDPFLVSMQLHGDTDLAALFTKAHAVFESHLDDIETALKDAASLRVHEANVGAGYTSWALTVTEPRGHITNLVASYLAENCMDAARSFRLFSVIAHYDPITWKSELRVVAGGTAAELAAELRARIGDLRKFVVRFGLPTAKE